MRGILLWIVPCAILWIFVTPLYNRILADWTESLVRLSERPAVSRVEMQDATLRGAPPQRLRRGQACSTGSASPTCTST